MVQDLADKDAIHADAPLAAKVHDAGICVAPFEKQVLVVFVYEVDFDFVQAFVEAFQHHMVPIWTQPEKLSEVLHVVFEDGHCDPRLQHAIRPTELKMPLFLLDIDGLVINAAHQITPEMVHVCLVARPTRRLLCLGQLLIVILLSLRAYSLARGIVLKFTELSTSVAVLVIVMRTESLVTRGGLATESGSRRPLPRTPSQRLHRSLQVLAHRALLLLRSQLIIAAAHIRIDVLDLVE